MKRGFVALVLAALTLTVGVTVAGARGEPTPLFEASGFTCGVFDRGGSPTLLTTDSYLVWRQNGTVYLRCEASGTGGSTIVTTRGERLRARAVRRHDRLGQNVARRNGQIQLECWGYADPARRKSGSGRRLRRERLAAPGPRSFTRAVEGAGQRPAPCPSGRASTIIRGCPRRSASSSPPTTPSARSARCSARSRSRSPRRAEVIVVDDASTDRHRRDRGGRPARRCSATSGRCSQAVRATAAGRRRAATSSSSSTRTRCPRRAGTRVSRGRSRSFRARSSAARARSQASRTGAGSPTSRSRRPTSRAAGRATRASSRPTASPSRATCPSAGTRATAARTGSSRRTRSPPATASSSIRASTPTTITSGRASATSGASSSGSPTGWRGSAPSSARACTSGSSRACRCTTSPSCACSSSIGGYAPTRGSGGPSSRTCTGSCSPSGRSAPTPSATPSGVRRCTARATRPFAGARMLIVLNADDFGASEETVRATIECFEQGALTSATIMPGMPATEAAVAYARSRPDLSFGVHLSFVANGLERPLSDPAALGGLVDDDGRFLPTGEARRRALLRRIPVEHDRPRGRGAARVPARQRRARVARRLAPAHAQARPVPRSARPRPPPLRHPSRPQRPGRVAAAAAEEPDLLVRTRLATQAGAPVPDDRALLHADERRRPGLGPTPCSRPCAGCGDGRSRSASTPASTRTGGSTSERRCSGSPPPRARKATRSCPGRRSHDDAGAHCRAPGPSSRRSASRGCELQGRHVTTDPDIFPIVLEADERALRPHALLLERDGAPRALVARARRAARADDADRLPAGVLADGARAHRRLRRRSRRARRRRRGPPARRAARRARRRRRRRPPASRARGRLAAARRREIRTAARPPRAEHAPHGALGARRPRLLRRLPEVALEEHTRRRQALREEARAGFRRAARARDLPRRRATATASSTICSTSRRRPTSSGSASRSVRPRRSGG